MDVLANIRRAVEANRQAAVDLLARLVRIDTVVPPGNNYREIAGVVAEYLRGMGGRVSVIEAGDEHLARSGADRFDPPLAGPRPNVLAEFGDGEGPALLIAAHLDVVPFGAGWTRDPLGESADGAFYGRGASDDKGGVVAMIMAMKGFLDAGYLPRGTITLAATVDEEVGGIAGLGAVLDAGRVAADYGIAVDGGSDYIAISNQGRFKGRIVTEGVAVHSSRPFQGVNAIETMARIVLAIQDHARQLLTRTTRIPAPPATGRPFIYPSANVGTIKGGLKENIVPDRCQITFSRRVTPEETLDAARQEFLRAIERAVAGDPGAKWRYDEMNTREPSYTDPDHPFVRDFQRIAQQTLNRPVPVYGGLGGSDACFMRNRLRIPTVELGVGREGDKAHGTDERVIVDDLINTAKVFATSFLATAGARRAA
jgi:succinyl-diaminopimelate desuccinylase